MKEKNVSITCSIPQGVQLALENRTITLTGSKGTCTKVFKMPQINFSKSGNDLVVSVAKAGVYEYEKIRTVEAHIKNMIEGCTNGFTYKLKICSSHFPMSAAITGNKLVVKNLFGEKVPREIVIKEGAKVVVKEPIIEVTGTNIDIVSQVAADIEEKMKIKNRDRRIFQDGIYIIEKAGKPI